MKRTTAGATLAWRGHRQKPRRRPGLPLLVFMTDTQRTPDPAAHLARLTPGTVVVFRHYDAPGREILGRRLARLARRKGLIFVVAGDRRMARRLGAQGLHLPEGMVARRPRFAPPGDRWPVSAAAHDERSARRAARMGVDLILMSPVFPTGSHPGTTPLGLRRLAKVCRSLRTPVLALGGVDPGSARRVLNTGAAGIAGIGALPHLCRDRFGIHGS
ncbi:MAG: thiamine phosphate synthase [Rhodospirillaceae bacterium]|nr:thiamine phosphate synthase [Rhodospirillaceae bacterium]